MIETRLLIPYQPLTYYKWMDYKRSFNGILITKSGFYNCHSFISHQPNSITNTTTDIVTDTASSHSAVILHTSMI